MGSLIRRLAVLVAVATISPLAAQATTIDPLLWQELAQSADFIGVVECDIAGGIVARYKVIETWKGDVQPGAGIAIRTATNYWEPQYPLSLVGDRFVVTAYRNRAPDTMASTTMGGPVPLWWRRIAFDYTLPLFQGAHSLTAKNPEPYELGSEHKTVDALKKDLTAFLALDAEKRELVFVKALTEKYLGAGRGSTATPAQKKAAAAVAAARTIPAALQALKAGLKASSADESYAYFAVLTKGGAGTRTWVRSLPATEFRSEDERERLLERYDELEKPAEPRAPAAAPTPAGAEKIASWKAALAKGQEASGFDEALNGLVTTDPAPVAQWLAEWTRPEKSWSDTDRGYGFGSWFAVNCSSDRTKHLTTLLAAKDPYIRAAAAIYLALENEAAGLPALRDAAKAPGDPGSWAALALARRGDRDGLIRALEVLKGESDAGGMAAVPKRNLRKRVAELLSNTAAAKGLPAPIRPDDADAFAKAKAWVDAHPDVEPVDPWMATLQLQKID